MRRFCDGPWPCLGGRVCVCTSWCLIWAQVDRWRWRITLNSTVIKTPMYWYYNTLYSVFAYWCPDPLNWVYAFSIGCQRLAVTLLLQAFRWQESSLWALSPFLLIPTTSPTDVKNYQPSFLKGGTLQCSCMSSVQPPALPSSPGSCQV